MPKYDISSIDKLQKETSIIENNGIQIILKPSAGEDRPGYLDPMELSVMEENHWAGNLGGEEPETPPSMKELLPIIREAMGFPNYNLNTVEIHPCSLQSCKHQSVEHCNIIYFITAFTSLVSGNIG